MKGVKRRLGKIEDTSLQAVLIHIAEHSDTTKKKIATLGLLC